MRPSRVRIVSVPVILAGSEGGPNCQQAGQPLQEPEAHELSQAKPASLAWSCSTAELISARPTCVPL